MANTKITSRVIADNAVTSSAIADGAITASKIASDAIDIVADTTPQLGGDLDLNSSDITGTGNINITGTIQSSGNITGTLATAAQTNITSVGTLTGFTSTGIDDNADATAITIDSSENVGIGTASPPHKLSVFGTGAGNATVQIEGEGGADPYINFLANNTQHWSLGIDDSDSDKFKISEHSGLGTNDYLVVDTSGNVGIGTTSPDTLLNIASSSAPTLRIENTDGSLGTDQVIGAVEFYKTDISGAGAGVAGGMQLLSTFFTGSRTALTFSTSNASGNNVEGFRLDEDGNLLVGKTAVSVGTAGIELRANNLAAISRSADNCLYLNRISNDGSILEFRKDNVVVGNIGTEATDIYIGTTDTGIRFNDAVNSVLPYNTSSGQTDNTLDLGFSSVRWKDLYLSGGVYLGGTGAANKLDDYEEGTWTPSGSLTALVYSATYTKIGRVVTIAVHMFFNSSTNTATADNITGLPFPVTNITSSAFPLTIWKASAGGNTNYDIQAHVYENESRIRLTAVGGAAKTYAEISDGYYIIGGSYFTDS